MALVKTLLKYLFALIFFIITYPCISQSGLQQIGARSAGMGYASATIRDTWSLFNNPGGLGNLKETSAVFAFENKFSITGLNVMAAGITNSFRIGTVGISALRFGDELYSEQAASLSFGNKLGIASLGVRVNYLQYNIEGFGNKGIATIDFGGVAEVTDQLRFGGYIRNINQAQISELAEERIATTLNAGLSYRPIKKVILSVEAEKDIDYDAFLRAGLEYQFLKKLTVRTGLKTAPFTNYFGLGFKVSKITIDYSLALHPILGLSHQAAVAYLLKRKE